MKNKFIYVFFAVTALLCCFIFSASAGYDIDDLNAQSVLEIEKVESLGECFATGDTDENGNIDSADARYILRVAVNLEEIDTSAFMKADVDGDGQITAADARMALRMAVKLDDIPEHDIEEIVISKPTCHSNGLTVKICKSCMKVYAIYEPSMSDDYHIAGGIEIVSPTCIDKGYYQRRCTVCEEVIIYREYEPTGIHCYGEWTFPNGNSCETASDMIKTCTVCGDVSKAIDPAGHNYGWIETQKVSCTQDGIEVYQCADCGLKGTPTTGEEAAEIITPAWEHHWDTDYTVTKEATCTENGTKAILCGFCGIAYEELTVPANGHDWDNAIVEVIDEANCCDEGLEKVICPICREYEERTVPITEHDIEGTWNITLAATCTEDGSKNGYCNYCRDNVTVTIPATGHTVTWANVSPATCTEPGLKIGDCSVCGTVGVTEEIPEVPHEFNYNNPVWVKATGTVPCQGIWSGYYKCKNCDAKEVHDDFAQVSCSSKQGNTVLTREYAPVSCTSPKMVIEYCQYCEQDIGEARSEGNAIPHDYEGLDWTVTKDATCTEAGTKEMSCKYNCGTSKKEEIPATGHSYGDAVTVVEPDCENEGEKESICASCGDVKTETIPATGHTAGEYTETKKATCTEEGEKVSKCTVCEKVLDTVVTDKTKHTEKRIVIADTGSVVDGNYEVKCMIVCSVCGTTIEEESTFKKILVHSDPELTVEFSQLPTELNSGDTVEFTVTGAAEGTELLVSINYLVYQNEILVPNNGTYTFTVPEGLEDADSIIVQIQTINAE